MKKSFGLEALVLLETPIPIPDHTKTYIYIYIYFFFLTSFRTTSSSSLFNILYTLKFLFRVFRRSKYFTANNFAFFLFSRSHLTSGLELFEVKIFCYIWFACHSITKSEIADWNHGRVREGPWTQFLGRVRSIEANEFKDLFGTIRKGAGKIKRKKRILIFFFQIMKCNFLCQLIFIIIIF